MILKSDWTETFSFTSSPFLNTIKLPLLQFGFAISLKLKYCEE